jgi:large subunit ribosomal protein L9
VQKLGRAFDVVKVKDGYARNFLLPNGLAIKVTKANIEHIKKEKDLKRQQEEKTKRTSQELADKLSGKSYTIPVLTNEEEKLYASISKNDILDAIKLEGIEVNEANIVINEPIKDLGIYDVELIFKYGIKATIKIWVVKK